MIPGDIFAEVGEFAVSPFDYFRLRRACRDLYNSIPPVAFFPYSEYVLFLNELSIDHRATLKNVILRAELTGPVLETLILLRVGPALELYLRSFSSSLDVCLLSEFWLKSLIISSIRTSNSSVLETLSRVLKCSDFLSSGALELAVGMSDVKIAKKLFECGVNSEFVDIQNLYSAFLGGNVKLEMFDFLISRGLFPETLDLYSLLFHEPIKCGIRILHRLLNRFHSLDTPTMLRCTYEACSRGNLSLLKVLLKRGFVIEKPRCLVECINIKVIKYLCDTLDTDIDMWHEGTTVLTNACRNFVGNELVRSLLKMGASTSGRQGYLALHNAAVYSKSSELCKLLISHGVDVNAASETGESVLHQLVSIDCGETLAAFLIKQGANVNAINDMGETPLICAVKSRHFKAAELLVRSGAFIDAVDFGGNTASSYVQRADCSGRLMQFIDCSMPFRAGQDRKRKLSF